MSPLAAGPATVPESPIILYLSLLLAAAALVLAFVPKVARSWTDWLEERRRTAVTKRQAEQEADDADLVELRRQVGNLRGELEQYRKWAQRHAAWDRKAYDELVRLGGDKAIGLPPSLL